MQLQLKEQVSLALELLETDLCGRPLFQIVPDMAALQTRHDAQVLIVAACETAVQTTTATWLQRMEATRAASASPLAAHLLTIADMQASQVRVQAAMDAQSRAMTLVAAAQEELAAASATLAHIASLRPQGGAVALALQQPMPFVLGR